MGEKPKLLLVSGRWGHMGGHSGLVPLADALAEHFDVTRTRPKVIDRINTIISRAKAYIGRARSTPSSRRWTPFYHANHALAESAGIRMAKSGVFDWVLFESVEDTFVRFAEIKAQLPPHVRLMGISHQPPAWWRLRITDAKPVQKLDALIALSSEAAEYLRGRLDLDVHFLHHGVDDKYFCPSMEPSAGSSSPLHILFCGQWLRDFDALASIIREAQHAKLDACFDLVVPLDARNQPVLYKIALNANTRWHAGLSDDAFKTLYHKADCLLLPLLDATANNSLVEAMALQTPLIVTAIGGVPDYVDASMATYLPENSDEAIAVLKDLMVDPAPFIEKARRAREHVEAQVNWRHFTMRLRQIADGIQE